MSQLEYQERDPLGVMRPGERFMVRIPLRAGGGFAHAARTGHQIAVTLSNELSTLIDTDDIALSREHGDGQELRIYANPIVSIVEAHRSIETLRAAPTKRRLFGGESK